MKNVSFVGDNQRMLKIILQPIILAAPERLVIPADTAPFLPPVGA
jgi:hypothetical protein